MSILRPHDRALFALTGLEQRLFLSAALPNAGAVSLAYDDTGALHAAYYDTAQHTLKYARRTPAGDWSTPETLDAGPNVGSELALALDAAGRPGIAYYDAQNADLKFVKRVKKSWVITTIDSTGVVGNHPSLAFAPGDLPVISYYAAGTQDLKLASHTGTRWRVFTLDARGTAGRFSTVAIDPVDGQWTVVYEDYRDRDVKMLRPWKRGIASTLIAQPGYGNPADNGHVAPELAFDDEGRLAIAYVDRTVGGPVIVRPGKRSWSRVEMASGLAPAAETSLFFDPDTGRPAVLFSDRTGSITLAEYDEAGDAHLTTLGAGAADAVAVNPFGDEMAIVDVDTGDVVPVDTALTPPFDLAGTPDGQDSVELTWTDSTGGLARFVIQRDTGTGTFETIATVDAGETSFVDDEPVEGRWHAYRIASVVGDARSAFGADLYVKVKPTPSSGVSAEAKADGVHVAWANHSTRATSYRVERSIDAGAWEQIRTLIVGVDDVDSFVDTGAPELSTVSYRVVAYVKANYFGDPSDEASAVTAITAPDDLEAEATSPSELALSWADQSEVETAYELWISTDGFESISTLLTALSAGTTAYELSGLASGMAYTVRVVAVDGDGNRSANSDVAVTMPEGESGRAADDFVAGISIDDPRWIDLYWTDNTAGETGWRVERSDDFGDFESIDVIPAGAHYYTDSRVEHDHIYQYRVIPEGASGDGAVSAVQTVIMSPAAPVLLQGVAVSGSEIDLVFSGWSPTTSYLRVKGYAATGGQTYTFADHVNPFQSLAMITELPDGSPLDASETYWFTVEAVGSGGAVTASNSVGVMASFGTPDGPYPLTGGSDHLDLRWADVLGETGYEIEWSTNGAEFEPLTTIDADVNSYTATGLDEATAYYFRMRALGGDGASDWGGTKMSYTTPAAPTGVTVVQLGDGTVRMEWDDESTAESAYVVEMSQGNDGYSNPVEVPAGSDAYVFEQGPRGAFEEGRTYRFSVRAISDQGTSERAESVAVVYAG